MQKRWVAWVVLAGALAVCPAVGAEQISAKILEEAEAKVDRIVGLIKAAESGNAEAQFELGKLIVEKDPEFIRKNASWEDPEAYAAAHREVDAAALEVVPPRGPARPHTRIGTHSRPVSQDRHYSRSSG